MIDKILPNGEIIKVQTTEEKEIEYLSSEKYLLRLKYGEKILNWINNHNLVTDDNGEIEPINNADFLNYILAIAKRESLRIDQNMPNVQSTNKVKLAYYRRSMIARHIVMYIEDQIDLLSSEDND